MLHRLIDTLRGLIAGTAEDVSDRNDLALLKQQLRDAGATLQAARKAVALATAQHEQDVRRISKITETIGDLEARAIAALAKGEEKLAIEAANAIAVLEDERGSLGASTSAFEGDLQKLNENVRRSEAQLRDLERGQRVATVREKVQAVSSFSVAAPGTSLADASQTLERIRDRQERGLLADTALAAMSAVEAPSQLVSRLADAGCGAPVRSSGETVLERLRASSPKLLTNS